MTTNEPTQEQFQGLVQIVQTLHENLVESLQISRTMTKQLGDETHKTVYGEFSLNKLIDFKKMDIKSYIGFLFLSKQNEEYFGDLDMDTILNVFTQVYDEQDMTNLVQLYLN